MRTQITKIKNERENIIIYPIKTKIIVGEDYEQLYANKLDSLDKNGQMAGLRQKLPKVTQEK